MASIASWQTEFPNPRTDTVVSYQSQNLLSVYPQLANSIVFLLDNPVSLGPAQQILHLLVNQLPSTIGLVNVIVSAVDRLQGATPVPPPPVAVPGAPQLATASAGGLVTSRMGARDDRWCAGRLRAARHLYAVPAVRCRSPSTCPLARRRALPCRRRCPVRSRCASCAVNAAGESPASNTVTFTVPPLQ